MKRIFDFYYRGFKGMSKNGKTLWAIIILKLFIMFAILKVFFFPNFLNTQFDNDAERSQQVIESITQQKK